MPSPPATDEALYQLAREIIAAPEAQWLLAPLAVRHGLSIAAFQRRFVALLGVSPRQLRDAARRQRMQQVLRAGGSVTEAIHSAGFGSSSRVYEPAGRALGVRLSDYRRGAAGEDMRWVCCSTRLGPLLIAATARGVCFAQFGDSPGALLRRLQAEFPRAALLPGAAGRELDDWMQALDAHLEGRGPRPRVPLDLRGTLFQVQVWSFLSALQDGETLSYAALARSLGRPSATRAVAAACAANRIAVLVPCHQVLRSDGGLGGYRWGVSRKQALLETQNSSPSGSG